MTEPHVLASYLKEQTGKEFCAFEYRASWALLIFLRSIHGKYGHRVALPSFLCHAPVAALVEAGMAPFFCDVDPLTGTVSDTEWLRAKSSGVRIFLWVHMFGIPRDSLVMREASANPDFLVIEDCCLAMGAKLSHGYCGSIGDASLFSFGPTKQADLGTGGAILLKDQKMLRSYQRVNLTEQKNPEVGEDYYRRSFYSQVAKYVSTGDRYALVGLIERYRPNLGGSQLGKELDAFDPQAFDEALKLRIHKHSVYEAILRNLPWIDIFSGTGMTPWRFVFRLPFSEPRGQHLFSNLLRETGINVSNWYFPAHLMMPFTIGQKLPGTEILSCSIFQLWLDDSICLSDIPNHCEKLVKTWEKFQEIQYEK